MVADGHFEGAPEGSQSTIYLQITGGPHRARTGDLRRPSADTILLVGVGKCH